MSKKNTDQRVHGAVWWVPAVQCGKDLWSSFECTVKYNATHAGTVTTSSAVGFYHDQRSKPGPDGDMSASSVTLTSVVLTMVYTAMTSELLMLQVSEWTDCQLMTSELLMLQVSEWNDCQLMKYLAMTYEHQQPVDLT